jgi:acyl dehydratase
MHKTSYQALEAGQCYVGPGRTLTETDHGIFMMLVGDWAPLHSDAEYAKSTRFGQRLMHGGFGVALALGMQAHLLDYEEPVIGALGLKEWTFKNPLFIGDTVHVEIEILGKRTTSRGDSHIVERKIRLVKQGDVVVQEGRSDVMLKALSP